jgi:hypothetical protein
MFTRRPFATGAVLALALALAGCGKEREPDVNALDQALSGNSANDADPALTSALADQIMVDPALAQSSNRNAIRAPDGPASAPVPPEGGPGGPQPPLPEGLLRAPPPTQGDAEDASGTTLGTLAAAQRRGHLRGRQDCEAQLRFSAAWAARLPAAIPIYPNGRVSEAAGTDVPGCGMRIVSFTADAPLQTVIDWYYTRAVRAGYSAEHRLAADDHVLAGARPSGDDAYYIMLADQGGRTTVDLVTGGE